MPFKFTPLDISGLILVEAAHFTDERGFFKEFYKKSTFSDNGIDTEFVQDNCSRSSGPVLRGLHYQLPPMEQAKLVGVIHGEIIDVAVDIRKGSPTYGEWLGVNLSDSNHSMLFVPPGFAHGFAVLSETADVFYKVSNEYSRGHERGIAWNDPNLNIRWPIDEPIISDADRSLPLLRDTRVEFEYTPKLETSR